MYLYYNIKVIKFTNKDEPVLQRWKKTKKKVKTGNLNGSKRTGSGFLYILYYILYDIIVWETQSDMVWDPNKGIYYDLRKIKYLMELTVEVMMLKSLNIYNMWCFTIVLLASVLTSLSLTKFSWPLSFIEPYNIHMPFH